MPAIPDGWGRRRLRRARVPAPWLLGAALLALAIGCGAPGSGPQAASLADLVVDEARYDGTDVVSEGTVRSHDDPLHYWIEDAWVNRVEIVPHDAVADLVGDQVRVTGTFTFAPDRGRVITVDEVEVISRSPRA